MWVQGDISSTKAEVGKEGRIVCPRGADGHEERALSALQTVLDSEGTGSVSNTDVPAEEQLTAALAALRCLEIPPSLAIRSLGWKHLEATSILSKLPLLKTPRQEGLSVPFVPMQRE